MEEEQKKFISTSIKRTVFLLGNIIVIAIVGIILLQYEIEGEKKLPFEISKMIVVSTAEGTSDQNENNKWNLTINQNNDVWLSINKNEKYNENQTIESIKIENFNILKKPKIGEIQVYRPAGEGLYKNLEEYHITESLEYVGSNKSNIENLEISNQGGTILFRFSNRNLGTYISNNDTQIIHDGKLLNKIKVSQEDIQTEVSFDIIIKTGKNIKYKTTINLELPVGEITKEGKSYIEKTDFSDIIFKRIK